LSHRPHQAPDGAWIRVAQRHLLIGWLALLFFLMLGIALEVLHGVKSGYYLDTRNATRRLMWTLAHAHGTLFSLVNIAFALSVSRLSREQARCVSVTSRGLTGALIVMPLGFFLGGLKLYGGDPGVGIFLVPVGALLLLLGVGAFVLGLLRSRAQG
jgi:hypothetical protein